MTQNKGKSVLDLFEDDDDEEEDAPAPPKQSVKRTRTRVRSKRPADPGNGKASSKQTGKVRTRLRSPKGGPKPAPPPPEAPPQKVPKGDFQTVWRQPDYPLTRDKNFSDEVMEASFRLHNAVRATFLGFWLRLELDWKSKNPKDKALMEFMQSLPDAVHEVIDDVLTAFREKFGIPELAEDDFPIMHSEMAPTRALLDDIERLVAKHDKSQAGRKLKTADRKRIRRKK